MGIGDDKYLQWMPPFIYHYRGFDGLKPPRPAFMLTGWAESKKSDVTIPTDCCLLNIIHASGLFIVDVLRYN